jgi:hypothetical protein
MVLRSSSLRKILESRFDPFGPYRNRGNYDWIPDFVDKTLGHLDQVSDDNGDNPRLPLCPIRARSPQGGLAKGVIRLSVKRGGLRYANPPYALWRVLSATPL